MARTAQAEQMLAAALDTLGQTTREDDVARLAAMNNLAIARMRQGHFEDGLRTLLELLGTQKRLLGDDHPQTLGTMNNIATAYERLRQNDLAEKYYRDSLTIKRRIYPPGHVSLLRSIQNLAAHLVNSDRLEEAQVLFQEATAEAAAHLEPDHELTLGIALRYARLRLKQRDYEAAFTLANQAFEGYARSLGASDERAIVSLTQALTVCAEAGQFQRGLTLLDRQGEVKLAERVLPDSKAMFYIACARIHAGMGRQEVARSYLELARPHMAARGIASASVERFYALSEELGLGGPPTTLPSAGR
jgi:tetratricopeptide (TPR) repeat protein